jgi:hypothetical protein
MPALEQEILTGESSQVGDYEITPMTSVLKLQLPWHNAGVIWNRPRAVRVKMLNGDEELLPVRDVTRITIWSMILGGLLGALIIGLMYHRE